MRRRWPCVWAGTDIHQALDPKAFRRSSPNLKEGGGEKEKIDFETGKGEENVPKDEEKETERKKRGRKEELQLAGCHVERSYSK